MMRVAQMLCALAARLLPPKNRGWGAAMAAELTHTGSDRAAFVYAAGCLVAAAKTRAQDFDTRFGAGLAALALSGTAFAAWHIACAVHGVSVLRGARDGFLEALIRGGGSAALVARYEAVRPIVIGCFFALGVAHLCAALCLARQALRGFVMAWLLAFAIAVFALVLQLSVVWRIDTPPSELVAVLVQAAALLLLLLWSNNRHLGKAR